MSSGVSRLEAESNHRRTFVNRALMRVRCVCLDALTSFGVMLFSLLVSRSGPLDPGQIQHILLRG